MNKDKVKIFLADLSHNYRSITARYVPYNIGLIASYAKKMFGDSVEIKLFKWPDQLIKSLKEERCDILGLSTYVWNSGLAHWAAKIGKKYNPNVITVLGGPHLPKHTDQKLQYFKENKNVDIRILLEGEIAFANIIKDSRLRKEVVAHQYPEYEEFSNRIHEYDKEHVFQNTISQRLLSQY